MSIDSELRLRFTPKEICYPNLGCFSNDYPFYDPPDRPISYIPDSLDMVGTEFFLNTRQNPIWSYAQDLYNTDDDSILNSFFSPNRDTKFICHGYLHNGNADWTRDMMTEFLNYGDFNVIRVNWFPGVIGTYGDATANSRIVGAEISFVIDRFRELYGYSASRIHILGHSLGAQTAGYAGERQPDLGRITGLDPAGPYFENTMPEVRLDITDAQFVDVIHGDTDPILQLGMGIFMPCGHLDFYPNGGREQPGCDQGLIEGIIVDGGIYDGIVKFVACNHFRAYYFFIESINGQCPFMATECPRGVGFYDDYIDGQCFNGPKAQLGMHADQYYQPGRQNVVYYHSTTDKVHFVRAGHGLSTCQSVQVSQGQKTVGYLPRYQFHVHIFLDDPWTAEQFRSWVYMSFTGVNGKTEEVMLNRNGESLELKPGMNYHFVGVTRFDPGTLTSVNFRWVLDYEWYNPGDWPIFDDPELFISTMTVESSEYSTSYNFAVLQDQLMKAAIILCLTRVRVLYVVVTSTY
ncbi:pancreatic triacylglycerol lipase-like [Amphiura filiformis]|uniref:pancreatic triacylglycerol lipase-like n=1 Tax=Amphiura filiformis TaxID=82378 RepID=UPI003B226B73